MGGQRMYKKNTSDVSKSYYSIGMAYEFPPGEIPISDEHSKLTFGQCLVFLLGIDPFDLCEMVFVYYFESEFGGQVGRPDQIAADWLRYIKRLVDGGDFELTPTQAGCLDILLQTIKQTYGL